MALLAIPVGFLGSSQRRECQSVYPSPYATGEADMMYPELAGLVKDLNMTENQYNLTLTIFFSMLCAQPSDAYKNHADHSSS